MKESTCARKLTGNYYFKSTWYGLILYVQVESAYTDIDKEGSIILTTYNDFRQATLSEAFELNLAHK